MDQVDRRTIYQNPLERSQLDARYNRPVNPASEQRYRRHLEVLAPQWSAALESENFDAVMVAAGAPRNYLFDDDAPAFRPNPHFALWFPHGRCEHALLLFAPGERPRLFFLQPADYWHLPQQAPDWAGACFELAVYSEVDALHSAARAAAARLGNLACIGEDPAFDGYVTNPRGLIDRLHFQRAHKTEFEIDCVRAATETGVAGHLAARDAFFSGASELDILRAFLAASGQTEAELPYTCIIAQNEHAATLHYQYYDRMPPAARHSFLIDAGARRHGYASDITRTYTATEGDVFGELIHALDAAQQALIETIRPGIGYLDLHVDMHRRLCDLLVEFHLVRCTAEAAFELGISRTFLPHGLGHLLGLQVHDVGGHQAARDGDLSPPPSEYAALRLTRTTAAGMVFTVEPGLYLIPMLLDELRASDAGAEVNWPAVEALAPCGGIRIEDNVLVTGTGTHNFTREAFAAAGSP